MTCILACPSFMCADRRVSEDSGSVSNMVKVAKNRCLVAAAAGNARSTLALVRAIRDGAQTAQALVRHVDKDSHALVLFPSGEIRRIEEGTLWPCPRGEIQAIGSGADMARGFLGALGFPTDRAVFRAAQRFVAKHRADCGGGVDFRAFA